MHLGGSQFRVVADASSDEALLLQIGAGRGRGAVAGRAVEDVDTDLRRLGALLLGWARVEVAQAGQYGLGVRLLQVQDLAEGRGRRTDDGKLVI